MILYGLDDDDIPNVATFNAVVATAIAALDRAPPEVRSREFVARRLEELHDTVLETLATEAERRFFSAALASLVRELRAPNP